MNIVFVTREGKKVPVRGKVGDNVLYLAHRYDIELEGGFRLRKAGTRWQRVGM